MRALPLSSSSTDGITFGVEAAPLGFLDQLADDWPGGPGDGNDEHRGAGRGRRLGHAVTAAEHGDPADMQAVLLRVIVKHRYRLVLGAALAAQPLDELAARSSCSEDNDLHRRCGGGAGAQSNS